MAQARSRKNVRRVKVTEVLWQAAQSRITKRPSNQPGIDSRSPLVYDRYRLLFRAGDDLETAAPRIVELVKRKVERFGWTFAPGDKVRQVENDYDKEVYNGDIGYIDEVNADASELTTSFDDRSVTYGFG